MRSTPRRSSPPSLAARPPPSRKHRSRRAAEPQLPPQYEVEIIVFANRNFDPTEERFEPTPNGFGDDAAALREVPVFDDTNFAPRGTADAVDPLAPVDPLAAQRAEALRIRPLRPEELKLGNEYRKLRAIAAYEPLVHAGWVQPGLPEADAEPFDLKTLGVLNPRGTVRVHLSRFLHITLDLTYQAERDVDAGGRQPATGSTRSCSRRSYRLAATRNARSNELHYFDHPAFGVLVRVTPRARARRARAAGRRPERLGENRPGPAQSLARAARERARDQRLGIVVRARRATDDDRARLDIAARLGARIVQLELPHALGDSLRQRPNLVGMLADGRRNQRRVVVARAQIAGAAQRAHDLRADHALAGIGSLVAERLPIDVELDDLEHEQRDEAPVAARHREIAPQHFLEVREPHEPVPGSMRSSVAIFWRARPSSRCSNEISPLASTAGIGRARRASAAQRARGSTRSSAGRRAGRATA